MQLGLGLGINRMQGGFNPASLFGTTTQGWWFDNSDISTLFQDAAGTIPVTAVGQSVRFQRDKSGRGNHRFQANTANAPTYQIRDGKPCLRTDGVDDWMQTNSFAWGSDEATVVSGIRKSSDLVLFGIVVEFGNAFVSPVGTFTVNAPGSSGARYTVTSRGQTSAEPNSPPSFPAPDTSTITLISKIGSDTCLLRRNGTQVASSSSDQGAGNYGNYQTFFFRRAGTAQPFNGDEFQSIGIARNLTASELAQIEAYATARTPV